MNLKIETKEIETQLKYSKKSILNSSPIKKIKHWIQTIIKELKNGIEKIK